MTIRFNAHTKKSYDSRWCERIPDLRDQTVKDIIAKNIQPACSYDNFFNQEELDWIRGYAFSCCDSTRHNEDGTVFLHGNLAGIYEKFADKINNILPGAENSPTVSGNFYITASPYGLHNDNVRLCDWEDSLISEQKDSSERRWVPWRNIIIPLYVAPNNTPSEAVFFTQRHIDFACIFHHNHEGGTYSGYPIARDYSVLQFYGTDGNPIDKKMNLIEYDEDHYQKYLSLNTSKRRLTGMTPELTCDWTPGSIMIFDSAQLHATNNGQRGNAKWFSKMGLLLSFLKEIS